MVRPGPASQTGRKRDSSDLELEDNSDMKKSKVVSDKDNQDELKTRIKKYLEENRNLKFIDIDEMSKNLHNAYPEYKRRKLNVFKGQVDVAFKTLTEAMASKKNSKKSKKQKKADNVVEVRVEDETTVKNKSMNNRMSSLYTTSHKTDDSKTTVSEPEPINIDDHDNDNDICEVIDDDAPAEVWNNCVPNNGSVSSKSKEPPLTDFEKTQLKVKDLAALQKSETLSSTPKPRVPSKNLSAFMNNSPGMSPKVSEIEKSITDKISNTSVSVSSDTLQSLSLPTPVPSRENGSRSSAESHRSEEVVVTTVRPATPKTKCSERAPPPPPAPRTPKSVAVINEVDLEEEIASKIIEKNSGKRTLENSGAKKRKKLDIKVQTSEVTFAEFGGNEDVLCNICKLLVHLKHPEVYMKLGVTPPRGFLLHGPPGCGKTLLAHAIAGELQLPFIKISAPEIVSGVSGESEQKLRELFEEAIASSPCVLFIDEIDSITPKRENAQREMERRIVAQLLTCLDELSSKPECRVVVIGATNRPDSLDPALRRAGRFDREIGLGIPDSGARRKILEVLCKGLRLEAGTDYGQLALLTPGYVGADLTSLTREAAMAAVSRVFGELCPAQGTHLDTLLAWLRDSQDLEEGDLGNLFIEQRDWREALKIVQPSAKREGFATVPDVTWADVGALETVREELQLAILAPVTHQEQFSSLGLPQSSGVLLVGPPGCGKTLVAKAIANEAGINFISVKGPELLNMYVGESERAVRSVFQRAKNSSPCVIFFDEVDSLCPRRTSSSSDSGSSSRVVNQLLTEMDGVEGRAGVWIMAATNRPDILDPAVLRPGRLDKILYVGFPGPRDRVEILRALTKNGTRPRLGRGVSLALVGEDERCEGFSGADVGNLVREASMNALRDSMKRGNSEGAVMVEKEHFEKAFRVLKPSVGGKDRARYEAMGKRYGEREVVDRMIVNENTDEGRVNDILSDNDEVEMIETQLSDVESNLIPSNDGNKVINTSMDIIEKDERSTNNIVEKVNEPNNGLTQQKDSCNAVLREESQVVNKDLKNQESNKNNKDDKDCVVSMDDTELDPCPVNLEKMASSSQPDKNPETNLSEKKNPKPVFAPKISIKSPDNLNCEVSKFYDSIALASNILVPEVQPPGVELRFLPDMVIRVMDNSTVKEIGGKAGKIVSVRAGGDQANVKLEGLSGARIVPVKEVEVELPEEGDKVKSLVWGSPPEVGVVMSLDDDDNAVVKFKEEQKTIQIDMLCKVEED